MIKFELYWLFKYKYHKYIVATSLSVSMQKETPKFNETDVYRVRGNSRLNQGLFLCKLILKKHGSLQIEGMGASISLVSKFTQILSKNGFATVKQIQSENV